MRDLGDADRNLGEPTVYEEQLETKFSRETENVFTLSLSTMMLTALVLLLLHFCERDNGGLFHCEVTTNFIIITIHISWAARQVT